MAIIKPAEPATGALVKPKYLKGGTRAEWMAHLRACKAYKAARRKTV